MEENTFLTIFENLLYIYSAHQSLKTMSEIRYFYIKVQCSNINFEISRTLDLSPN